jgi:hypothetical protein
MTGSRWRASIRKSETSGWNRDAQPSIFGYQPADYTLKEGIQEVDRRGDLENWAGLYGLFVSRLCSVSKAEESSNDLLT